MSNPADFKAASQSPDESVVAVTAFLQRHVDAMRKRLNPRVLLDRPLKSTDMLFSIWTDKDGTIIGGKNSAALSTFLCDALNAGINVDIASGVHGHVMGVSNPLAQLLAEKDPARKIIEKPFEIEVFSKQCLGMYIDDDQGVRKAFESYARYGMALTVLDPNSPELASFLNHWSNLSEAQKAEAFGPWLELKSLHTQPKPAPGAEPA